MFPVPGFIEGCLLISVGVTVDCLVDGILGFGTAFSGFVVAVLLKFVSAKVGVFFMDGAEPLVFSGNALAVLFKLASLVVGVLLMDDGEGPTDSLGLLSET